MSLSFYYISEGKLFKYDGTKESELSSVVLNSYLEKVRDSAKRSEWKYNGQGAEFTGTYRPGADAESAVGAVYSKISSVREYEGDLLYSLTIDRTNGIYRKFRDNESSEGIVLCSFENKYYDFDINDSFMAVSVAFGEESDIGIYDMRSKNLVTHTEGHTIDHSPVWSKKAPNKVYFCSTGLPNDQPDAPKQEGPKGYGQIVSEMYESTAAPLRGPTSICLIDTKEGTLDEILCDDRYDYIRPQSTNDGSLYYVKKPYSDNSGRNPLGVIGDILLFPVRIVGAIFSFLNVFSATYSGKTLTKGSNVKNKDKKQTFIDGNLINAEKELKDNQRRGDKYPGIIPHSWELHRRDSFGNDTVIKKGVLAYKVLEDGRILVSNGSSIILVAGDGKEEKIVSASKVSFIE